MELSVEEFWEQILSREPERVLEAWKTLSEKEQRSVWHHLEKMVYEDGWADPQRDSAKAALRVLRDAGI